MKIRTRTEWMRAILVFLFSILPSAQAVAETFNVIYVNGIMNTPIDTELSRKRLDSLLKLSRNYQGPEKHTFQVTYVYNPIGHSVHMPPTWFGTAFWADATEIYVLKTSEELNADIFRYIVPPHDNPMAIDRTDAANASRYVFTGYPPFAESPSWRRVELA